MAQPTDGRDGIDTNEKNLQTSEDNNKQQNEDLENRISELGNYLEEHGTKIMQLYASCGAEYDSFIQPFMTLTEHRSQSEGKDDGKSGGPSEGKGGDPSEDKAAKEERRIKGIFAKYALVGGPYSYGFYERSIGKIEKIHEMVPRGFHDSKKTIKQIVELISFFMIVADILEPKAVPFTTIIRGAARLEVSKELYSKILENEKISKMLSPAIWKEIEKYRDNENRFLLEETIHFYQPNMSFKKRTKYYSASLALDWLYTNANTEEQFITKYDICLKKVHMALLSVYECYKRSNIDPLSYSDLKREDFFTCIRVVLEALEEKSNRDKLLETICAVYENQ